MVGRMRLRDMVLPIVAVVGVNALISATSSSFVILDDPSASRLIAAALRNCKVCPQATNSECPNACTPPTGCLQGTLPPNKSRVVGGSEGCAKGNDQRFRCGGFKLRNDCRDVLPSCGNNLWPQCTQMGGTWVPNGCAYFSGFVETVDCKGCK